MAAYLKRGLKLRHLQLLAALHEAGQLGLAAENLGMAQPAASRLLAEIEAIVGHAVHERIGRGLALTEVGASLARRAARVLIELDDAEREISGIAAGARGHLRIGSVTGPAMDRVLPALRHARLALPDVTAEVYVAPSDLLCEQLLAGRLDFVIGRLPEGQSPDLFDIRLFETEPVVLLVRRGHHLAGLAAVTPQDLLQFDWVMPGQDAILGRTVRARLAALGLPLPPQRLSTSSFLLTLAMMQQSNAIAPIARAVADTFAAGPDAPYVKLPIDLGIEVEPFGLITRAGSSLPPVVLRIIEMVAQKGTA
ncbi:MAG: LysR family transcriptional regulator [Pseudorhodobacter sp.]|nr:MAG: LysR family transcriptional regulator [Pseudorhodobacter sp.]